MSAGFYARLIPEGPIALTGAQFDRVMVWGGSGGNDYLPDGQTRVRYVIAAALEDRGRERRGEGRPDVAGRLSWLEGQVREGRPGTKRVVGKLRKDIQIVRSRLCDGAGWTYGAAR